MGKPVVLVTGALSGIGRAAAFAFAAEGADIVVSGRRLPEGEALEAALRAEGVDALFVAADVRDEDQVRTLVDAAVARFGRLDVAINNAGVEAAVVEVDAQTVDEYRRVMDANVLGTLLCMKHELRVMKAQGEGAIVNLSSNLGHRGMPGMSVYVAAKHAVEGLTKAAALEAASYGVRVNAVAPGPVDTPMFDRFAKTNEKKAEAGAALPVGRIGTPEEIAQALVFLGLAKAPYIVGHILAVDGGITAR